MFVVNSGPCFLPCENKKRVSYTDWKIRIKWGKMRKSHRNVSRLPSFETIQKLKSCLSSIDYLNHARILKIPIFLLDLLVVWNKAFFFNLASWILLAWNYTLLICSLISLPSWCISPCSEPFWCFKREDEEDEGAKNAI